MAWPAGLQTRTVTFGAAFGTADGEDYGMRVEITPSRVMVWAATGQPAFNATVKASTTDGMQGSLAIPITTQGGWLDANGNVVTPDADENYFYYLINAWITQGGKDEKSWLTKKAFVLPAGDGPVDLDTLMVAAITGGGGSISVPDYLAGFLDELDTSDSFVAGLVDDDSSATKASLDATYGTVAINDADTPVGGAIANVAAAKGSEAVVEDAAPRAGLSAKVDFSAVGDGVQDDTAALQAMIDAARDAVRAGFALGAGTVFLPSGRYRVTGRIVQPPYVKVVTLGPVVIQSESPGDSAWHITPLSGDPTNLYPSVLSKQQWTMGDLIDASHGGLTFVNADSGGAGSTIGLELGSRTDLTGDRPLSRYTLGHIAVQGYHEGWRWNSYNHYIAHYSAIKLELNDIALHVVGPGTNSGENITFEESLFASTTLLNPAVQIDAPNIDLNFDDCSADFVNTVFLINQGYGTVRWQGGHLEGVNESTRYSATGGIAVSTVVTSGAVALPVVTIGPNVPFVCAARGVRFRGEMYLSASLQYRVQSNDYNINQHPDKGVLCDASVRVVDHTLIHARPSSGPLMQRALNEVRDDTISDTAGTLGSALANWTRTNGGGTVTSVVSTDAPTAGYQSLQCTLAASSSMRWMPKAYSACRPNEIIYGTFAYKLASGAPALIASIMVAWYDSEKTQIGTTGQIDLSQSVATANEWRLPDGPVKLTPPQGAAFYKAGFQISVGASGDGTSNYWVGAPQFERRHV